MAVLEARRLTKRYTGVTALRSVDISIEEGQVHGIVGENGAGKSTLIKCLTGVITPDEGMIFIEGENALEKKAMFSRVAYVPQEIDLFGDMTVAENLFLPFEKHGIRGPIRQKTLNRKASPLLRRFRLDAPADSPVAKISVSAQQLLQSVRAIVNENYRVLVLDEPTTSLTSADTDRLFQIISELKSQDKAIVFISHKLEEVIGLADTISVFRNGENIAFRRKEDADIPWIVTRMTGRNIALNRMYGSRTVKDRTVLEVSGLSGSGFSDITFSVKAGEILGFSGLVGSGRSEVMQTILGVRPAGSGKVRIGGKPLPLGDAAHAVQSGFIYLPEERKHQAILAELSVRENISISLLSELSGVFGISLKRERKLVNEIIRAFQIKNAGIEQHIRFLSGGNQQKVIIGRAMRSYPKVLVFDEPTKGVDVGTKAEIYALMQKLAETEEVGIILISSEMDEVKKCANRIITLHNGKKTGEFGPTAAKERIMQAIFGEITT